MRVLVTRAEPAASRTAERLRALGHDPVVVPLAEATHDAEAAGSALSNPHRAIAVTSAQAIRAVSELDRSDQKWKDVPLFAVGEATAQAARQAGFTTVTAGPGRGVDLAETVHTWSQNNPSKQNLPFLYLAGLPRSADFEERLTELQISFETCVCYRMTAIHPDPDLQRQIMFGPRLDAVLLYSAESAKRLFSLDLIVQNPLLLSGARFHCLSEKVAAALPEPYDANAVICDVPDESNLLRTL